MSQLVLDDQLDLQVILPALKDRVTAVRLQDLRPGEHILDDRVPELLRTLKQPAFVTIDRGFWRRELCHPAYCVRKPGFFLFPRPLPPIMINIL
jgi:hypothetical protein